MSRFANPLLAAVADARQRNFQPAAALPADALDFDDPVDRVAAGLHRLTFATLHARSRPPDRPEGPAAMTALADIAPRLAAARTEFVAAELAWDRERRRLIAARYDLQRLVAHRDLQVIRSESRRRASTNHKYMTWRRHKLERAQASLARVEEALATLEQIPPGTYGVQRGQR